MLLRVPGYTQGMRPAQSIPDMAVLSLNIRGHGNSTDDEPAYEWWGPGDYLLRGLDDPQKFFYRGAIMDCLRGVDFVASRPEVDTKTHRHHGRQPGRDALLRRPQRSTSASP